ncbi:MAG: DNA (cytosine-5-)-methyltransferase [Nodularia sp. (in: Bacteria)]|nr:MAG: DNA (cytosine-5-)-methyltransferase [Nodularia sp. (in: cyanobacteria)]
MREIWVSNNKRISISLFAGAFGLDLGMEQAGFHTVSVVEIDPDATKTIVFNRPHLAESAVPRDIQLVSAQTLLEEGGRVLNLGRALRPGEVDLVTGGPPCQPFSTAGKRQSIGDPRGSLFMDFIRVVKEIKPRFFVMENVRGLLSAPLQHRPHVHRGVGFLPLEPDEMQGAALRVVLAEMKNIGYSVVYHLLEAADYGVPQSRQRVVFIGSRDHEPLSFPLPTHCKNGIKLPKWHTLQEALRGLIDPKPEFFPYSHNRLKYLKLLKAGQNWRYLPDELKEEAMGGAYKSGGGKVGFYRRLGWNKPSPTVTTSPHQKATDMCHPEELRPLSVRECAWIQTFPDDWVFYGSCASKYRQIGNAVPVQLARAIGKHIYQLIKEGSIPGKEAVYQLELFQLPSPTKFSTSHSQAKKFQNKELFMTDKAILNSLFKEAGIKRSALLAECVCTLDNYLNITEQELRKIQWVNKSGQNEQMIKNQQIEDLIIRREYHLKDIYKEDEKIEKLKSVSIFHSHVPVIKNILGYFISSTKALNIARKIQIIDDINVDNPEFIGKFKSLIPEENGNIIKFFAQKNDWSYDLLARLPNKIETFAKTLFLRAKFHNEEVSIISEDIYLKFKQYLLRNWFALQSNPQLLLDDEDTIIFRKKDTDQKLLNIAVELLGIPNRNLNLLLLFLDEIVKMESDIPELAKKAISTGNPFLFRSLFLNFKEAEEFAVGGKLNSSLETKYGNLFEKLMVGFAKCREIYDGGVDVAVGCGAFDIKSGPKVMNKGMVDAFSAKQLLIQDKKLLPDLATYQVALGYGKKDDFNSFMAKVETEILDGREAWTKITGIDYSPEIIFAIAGLVPRIFGVESLVGSILGKGNKYQKNDSDVSAFQELFTNHFTPINLTPAAEKEINSINSLVI